MFCVCSSAVQPGSDEREKKKHKRKVRFDRCRLRRVASLMVSGAMLEMSVRGFVLVVNLHEKPETLFKQGQNDLSVIFITFWHKFV